MGVDVRTVQRSFAKLQDDGLIEKVTIQTEFGEQTVFTLDGLLRELSKHARSDPAYRPRVRIAADVSA